MVESAFRLIEKQVEPVCGTSHHLTEIKRKGFSVGSKVIARVEIVVAVMLVRVIAQDRDTNLSPKQKDGGRVNTYRGRC